MKKNKIYTHKFGLEKSKKQKTKVDSKVLKMISNNLIKNVENQESLNIEVSNDDRNIIKNIEKFSPKEIIKDNYILSIKITGGIKLKTFERLTKYISKLIY